MTDFSKDREEDELEGFIRQNKSEMDNRRPGRDLWNRIESELEGAPQSAQSTQEGAKVRTLKPNPLRQWLPIAALLIVTAGAVVWMLGKEDGGAQDPVATVEHPLMQELKSVEAVYSKLVVDKAGQIRNNPSLDTEDAEEALAFLTDLEGEYNNLKTELGSQVDAGKVLEAMIENYRQRIEVLEHMSRLLQKPSAEEQEDKYANSILL